MANFFVHSDLSVVGNKGGKKLPAHAPETGGRGNVPGGPWALSTYDDARAGCLGFVRPMGGGLKRS